MNKKVIIEMCNNISKNTLIETLSIKFTDIGEDFVEAKMPVNKSVHQPDGILHGGATAALAETVGSTAAFVLLKRKDIIVRGIEISTNHLKSISQGEITAIAKPINLGRTIQLWEIKITDQEGQLISISKLTTYTRIKKND
tara:strand:- start:922 stop:1344 length:423 start_codon:yes stop_codon:yes gene_type:complete